LENQKARIRDLGEQLDKLRKDRQAEHSDLTLTGMYNVLEKLRAGDELTEKERGIHDKGLVATLRSIHDDLDAAVFDAYGWPADLDGEEILERLVALNSERAEEERKGTIRWLRPEYQEAKAAATAVQEEMDVGVAPKAKKAAKRPWPKALPEQVEAVRAVLAEQSGPVTANDIAKAFKGARKARVKEVLETLAALGRVRKPTIDLFGL
jgi:superfamily II RNA helicase